MSTNILPSAPKAYPLPKSTLFLTQVSLVIVAAGAAAAATAIRGAAILTAAGAARKRTALIAIENTLVINNPKKY